MDDFKNELKELNSNLERIARSLERTEALNEKMVPFIEAYLRLLNACGVQDDKMVEKIALLVRVGIDEAYEDYDDKSKDRKKMLRDIRAYLDSVDKED